MATSKTLYTLVLILAIPIFVSGPAHAAAAGDSDGRSRIADGVWASADGSKVTYEAGYFEQYQTVTAAVMLRWVPGGAALVPNNPGRRNDDEKRGFGSGGDQVLINGKRLSGKSNDIGSALQRIQAEVVARIEVIRGTAAGLDVRSEGTLVNIVLHEDVSGGSGSWQLHSGFYGRSDADLDGLVSYSNSAGSLNYLVSAQYGPYNRGNQVERYETYYAPGSGAVLERRDITLPMLQSQLVLDGSVNWLLDSGAVLNLNARTADHGNEERETTVVSVPGDSDNTLLENVLLEDGLDWELGGDFEQRIGPGRLKTRVIYTHKTSDQTERVSLSSTVPGNVPAQSLVETDDVQTEAIVRTSYSLPLSGAQQLELGIEGAQNTLAKDVQLFAVEANGDLTPVPLFNAMSDVTEDRYEFFSTHFWQLRPDVVLESALNFEFSTIGQQGADVANKRSFTYPKPRLDLRWDLTEVTQLRASLERTVGQLDFGFFVASFDNDNDQVDAGNPELEPEKAWEAKFAWERRLANDSGVLQAELFYNDVEDHIDNIRVTDTLSAAGNIGDAEYYGIALKASWRLAAVGLEGAVIDANYTLQDSQTTDPFTGMTRAMSDKRQQEYVVNFRHDVAAWRLNYNVEVKWNGERHANDINFREVDSSVEPDVNAGFQYRLSDRVLLWFDTRLVFDGHSQRTRERYIGNVADGNLLRHEEREQYFRREFIVGLRGQF